MQGFPSKMHVRVFLLLPFLLLFLLNACGSTSTHSAVPASTATSHVHSTPTQTPTALVHVNIVSKGSMYAFDPSHVMVKIGTQVVWTNRTNAPHTVSSDSGIFNSPNTLETGQSYSFTFAKAGNYSYYCNFHLYMKAIITVTS